MDYTPKRQDDTNKNEKALKYNVSVVIPVYNAEKYINKCIDSIINQTLDDIEIILIDDGSTDGSGVICDDYSKIHSNIVVKHITNGGPSKARNIGLDLAHGNYVGFVDADDYIEPDMYELMFQEATCFHADIVMCGYSIGNEETRINLEMNYNTEYYGKTDIITNLMGRYYSRDHNGLYSVCNKLFKSGLVESLRFNEELIRAEDAWFVFDCLKKIQKFRFLNKSLYVYRQVSTSTMHTVQSDRYFRSKKFRMRLLEQSKCLNIDINNNEFYYEFLYETIMFCRDMRRQNKIDIIKLVLFDDFFYCACKYRKLLPFHIKFICCLERARFYRLIVWVLKKWR